MLRWTLPACLLLLVAVAATAHQQDDEILVVGKKLALANGYFAVTGSRLRICTIRASSGDKAFDRRICGEARVCVEQGYRDEKPLNDCVNQRLVIWERGRDEARIALGTPARQPTSTSQPSSLDEGGLLRPGRWDVRRSDSPTPRTLCLRADSRSAKLLRLLYENGEEPERNHGSCAKWIFSHQSGGFRAARRCFQPNYRLSGEMTGSVGAEVAEIDATEDRGTSSADTKSVRTTWSAKRTGDCPS